MKSDWLCRLKDCFKKYPELYHTLIVLLSPIHYPAGKIRDKIRKNFDLESEVVINVGSGPVSLHKNIINVDIERHKNVHVIADAMNLPFKDHSVDGVITIAVLEHIKNPEKALLDFYRIIKPRGRILTYVPFIQGYHASPHDYHRWTIQGIEEAHRYFLKVESGVCSGPTSALVWILTEWLAMIFSMGSLRLYKMMYIAFMLTLWPLKFLDILISTHPVSSNIASVLYFVGKKK
ncbi:MAG: class I SAM-dependent methyltransferase [Chlamydiota bacterium]